MFVLISALILEQKRGESLGSDSGSISLWRQKKAASYWTLTTSASIKLLWVLIQLSSENQGSSGLSNTSEILLSLVAS